MNTISQGNWINTVYGGAVVLAVIPCDNGTAYEVFLWQQARIACIDNEDVVVEETAE